LSSHGNGRLLVDLLAPRGAVPEAEGPEILEIVRAAVRDAGSARLLYSSDRLFTFDAGQLADFRDAMASDAVAVKAAVVVRDVVPHALASYSHLVRHHLHTGSFAQMVDGTAGGLYRFGAESRLRRLVETLGRSNVTVLHYDSLETSVFRSVASNVLGLLDLSGFDLATHDIGRQFTRREVEIRRALNAHLQDKRGGHRLNAAVVRRASLGRLHVVTRTELDFLLDRFAREVDWINEQFFPGEPLSVAGTDVEVLPDGEDLMKASEVVTCLYDCLSDLMTRSGG